MGCNTAGAGGYVLSNSHYNTLGIRSYSFTGSIAERLNGKKMENLGVTPDITYNLTERDLESGHVDFANEIDKVINTVILNSI